MWTLGHCGVADETYLQIQPVGTEDPSNPSSDCLLVVVEKDHVVLGLTWCLPCHEILNAIAKSFVIAIK